MLDTLRYGSADWDADSPPDLEFLFEARVKLHLPPLEVGALPDDAWINNIIAVTKSRTGDGGPIHRVFAVR